MSIVLSAYRIQVFIAVGSSPYTIILNDRLNIHKYLIKLSTYTVYKLPDITLHIGFIKSYTCFVCMVSTGYVDAIA